MICVYFFFLYVHCLQEVKQYFEDKGAKERSYLQVEFKEKSISLDIPMREGVLVDEWKLTALVPPHVRLHLNVTCISINVLVNDNVIVI